MDIATEAVIATHRFGLGPGSRELETAMRGPRDWLLQQLTPLTFDARDGDTASAIAAIQQHKDLKKAQKEAQRNGNLSAKRGGDPVRRFHAHLVQDSLQQLVESDAPFQLRLLDFFSNHFSVTGDNVNLRALGPLLEREAIAPNLTGRFEDMLVAVEQHPAMLLYLNNEKSVGPDSSFGRRKKGDINENLAREILELHTLGVDGGYELRDIQELAMAITGWSVARENGKEQPGFVYRPERHQPGRRHIVGRDYAQRGTRQGEAALRDLAVNPSTARFVSFKLAQHLISDEPPKAVVDAMQDKWLQTNGNLKAVINTLVEHDAAWQPERQKFKSPREFVVSCLRACGTTRQGFRSLENVLGTMGQAPFKAGSPAGYSALNSAWTGSDALMKRVDWVAGHSNRLKVNPRAVLRQTFGDTLPDDTRLRVERAESRSQSLALLMLSPEFQRR